MMLSAVMEDYLKAIYQLQHEGDGERVRTSAIAEHLDVTPPTVTSMLSKLEERGLADREKYKGVSLTPEGERVALEVIRHHRLLEAYLTEHLDFAWSEVHDEADRLEHHISEAFEERVAATLEDPTVDPHGAPIPNADLEPPAEPVGDALAEYDAGTTVEVREVNDRDPEILEYLSERGVNPGVSLAIEEVAPFGMVTVRPEEGEPVSLPEDVARHVRVAPVPEAAP
ncbi:metal-dependent transcriptional regulator [Halalkalicoccus sp. NIPERK01]|uniref:metal-dependent transcriptional regulator n=1 Tax=Halalkalicoccus sp. NIPERK01 TaxID=3053469 RepID=UPI0034E96AFD